MYLTCPQCHSNHVTKNGFNRLHKQLYKCQDCGRQFVLNPAKGPVPQETQGLTDRLLLETISLAASHIKGKSAIHLARVYGERQRNYRGQHFWARGYY